jgi:hypothetical protein
MAYATDSLFEGKRSIKLFHEILTSPLNRNNSEIRSLSDWGIGMMKKMIEELVLRGEIIPENNSESFENAVQRYVNSLNACTDSVVSDSSFHSQFWVELSKAQLFRSLGNTALCFDILSQLNTCNIEGEELDELLYWKSLTLSEMTNAPAMSSNMHDSVFTNLSNSLFPFGIQINGPNDVQFFDCYGTVKDKKQDNTFRISPSVNNGAFNVALGKAGFEYCIYSNKGQLISKGSRTGKTEIFNIDLIDGVYFFKIISYSGNTDCQKFIVNH